MKNTPYERLKADNETNQWWQAILDNPRFALVVEAAKHQLDASPPQFVGVDPMQTFALLEAARRGGVAFLAQLENLGATAMAEQRVGEEQAKAGAALTHPSQAGMGYGRHSPPPPEIAPNPQQANNG